MKRLLFIFTLSLVFNIAYPYPWIKTAIFQNGIWYPWEKGSGVIQSGTYNQFTVHHHTEDPSKFYFRITIDNFYIPDKKTRKEHIKNNEWYEYTGYIEYWIDDEHLNFLSCLPNYDRLLPNAALPWYKYDGRPSIIKKSPAKIQIQPYEKTPQIYNIWFEGIGYAFYFYQTGY
jgi:hypothetical protein